MTISERVREQAQRLAEAHKRNDPEIRRAFWFEDDEEVRLVEVTYSTPTTGEVLPLRFKPQDDEAIRLEFPTVVVLLSPEEWKLVERGELELPEGWSENEQETLEI